VSRCEASVHIVPRSRFRVRLMPGVAMTAEVKRREQPRDSSDFVRRMLSVVESKLHGDQHPDGHGSATASGRCKTPALHSLCSGLVEFRLASRALYLHGLHPTLVCDPDLEQDGAFNPPPSHCFWIARLHLVPAEGTDSALGAAATTPTPSAAPVSRTTATAVADGPTLFRTTPFGAESRARATSATASTTAPWPWNHCRLPVIKKLASACFPPFNGLRRLVRRPGRA
jgi:hypothetical protein